MGFVRFMVTGAGRMIRVLAGLAFIAIGLAWVGGTGGYVLAVVGLLPLLAGMFDFCAFAPLFKLPFLGREVRALQSAG